MTKEWTATVKVWRSGTLLTAQLYGAEMQELSKRLLADDPCWRGAVARSSVSKPHFSKQPRILGAGNEGEITFIATQLSGAGA